MRRECVPGSLSPPPESEPGFEASNNHMSKLGTYIIIESVDSISRDGMDTPYI